MTKKFSELVAKMPIETQEYAEKKPKLNSHALKRKKNYKKPPMFLFVNLYLNGLNIMPIKQAKIPKVRLMSR